MTSVVSFRRKAEAITVKAPVGGSGKRLFDIVVGLALIVALTPLMLTVLVAALVTSGGSAVYRHRRIGFGGQDFDCLKFRTMYPDADRILAEHLAANPAARAEWDATRKLKNDPRVTPVGRLLRQTSLDELPQLVNVVRGEMSLVGPRPIVHDEVHHYADAISAYIAARPGMTGLWQVSGRSDASYRTRVQLDRSYVQNWSFGRDVVILVRTVPAVVLARGSY